MPPPDDIKGIPDSEPEPPAKPPATPRRIGPESEVRGGPEAPGEQRPKQMPEPPPDTA